VFGSISWSRDFSKVTFVGEVPAISTFKNPWDLPAAKKEEETKNATEKKDEHW
jgi:hypothetical protein